MSNADNVALDKTTILHYIMSCISIVFVVDEAF
jgi:hypothetical protein